MRKGTTCLAILMMFFFFYGKSQSAEISEGKVKDGLQKSIETFWWGKIPDGRCGFDKVAGSAGAKLLNDLKRKLSIIDQNSPTKKISLVKASFSDNVISYAVIVDKLPESNKYKISGLEKFNQKYMYFDIGKRTITKIIKIEKNNSPYSTSKNEYNVFFTYKTSLNDLGKTIIGTENAYKGQAIIEMDVFTESVILKQLREGPVDQPEVWFIDSVWEKKLGEKTQLEYCFPFQG